MNKPITIYEVDEIQKVVNFLTAEKTIDSIQENSGTSTIYIDSTVLLEGRKDIHLTSGLYIKIGTKNYKTSNVVKDRSFNIEAEGISEDSAWSLALEFRPGSLSEVDSLLINAAKKPEEQWKQFPLLWMIIDSTNKRNSNFAPPVDFEYNLKLAMINTTEKEYKVNDRLENNFKPTIKPYVDLIVCALRSVYFSSVFHFEEEDLLDYSEFFRYFYGSSDKEKMVFDSITDAIEIEMPLKFKQQYSCIPDLLLGIGYYFDDNDLMQSRADYVPDDPATETSIEMDDNGDLIETQPDNYVGVNLYIDNDDLVY